MKKLEGSEYKSCEECLTEKDEKWLNVNISMKASLRDRIDKLVESNKVPYKSRSRLVRMCLREKLNFAEEMEGSQKTGEILR